MVNWLDLPRDLMIKIFHKVGTIELLRNAQRVCSFWLEIAKDPELYRVIDLYNPSKYLDVGDRFDSIGNFTKLAIDRSRGGLVEFSIESFGAKELLREMVGKAPRLKCLRIANYGLDEDHLIEVFEKLPLLEEVEFILPLFPPSMVKVLEAVGRSCTKLKSFRLNGKRLKLEDEFLWEFNEEQWDRRELGPNTEAFAIARSLNPALRSLYLLGNLMKNNGLEPGGDT